MKKIYVMKVFAAMLITMIVIFLSEKLSGWDGESVPLTRYPESM